MRTDTCRHLHTCTCTTTISDNVLEQFRAVAKLIAEAHIRSVKRAKAAHERFNVFTTLLEPHDEVCLHTRFLHCLLDPKGYHDCDELFLDLFFATIKEQSGLDDKDAKVPLDLFQPEKWDLKKWDVNKEVPIPDVGKIDLLLQHREQGFGIAIENKIYAGEQAGQIGRYAKFLSGRFGSNARVFYLTLHGEKSETHADWPYIRISYAKGPPQNNLNNWISHDFWFFSV